jgi:flagellar assembly factor FliW
MKLDTKNNNHSPQKDLIIHFPEGLHGFEKYTSFQLFHEEEDQNNKPLPHSVYWLQSTDNPDVRFSTVLPNSVGIYYEVVLNAHEESLLQLENPENTIILLMLTINMPSSTTELPSSSTQHTLNTLFQANIPGPILINSESRIGIQKVSQKLDYSINIHAE